MSSGDCLTSLMNSISDATNSKTWVKIIDYLDKLKEWFMNVLSKENEVDVKKNTEKCLIRLKIKSIY